MINQSKYTPEFISLMTNMQETKVEGCGSKNCGGYEAGRCLPWISCDTSQKILEFTIMNEIYKRKLIMDAVTKYGAVIHIYNREIGARERLSFCVDIDLKKKQSIAYVAKSNPAEEQEFSFTATREVVFEIYVKPNLTPAEVPSHACHGCSMCSNK